MTAHASAGPLPSELRPSRDALVLLDVDEVVLHFIEPFRALLDEVGAHLSPDSFHLTGNVRSRATGAALSGGELDAVTERLYREQEARQRPVEGVGDALEALQRRADIVFLSAMTPIHHAARRRLLDRHSLGFPLIATTRSKGSVAAELTERWSGSLVFVDDLPPNLVSVSRSVPAAGLVHLMANDAFRCHLPPLPPGAIAAVGWPDATDKIEALLAAG